MSRDMKRLTAPRSWPVPRKIWHWITKPSPGPHPKEMSIPLLVIVRDMLGLSDTAHEARLILANGEILVDGRPVRNRKFPVGLMDVISIPRISQHYRMLLNSKGKFELVKIREGKEKWKLCRIENKVTARGGKTQLCLHDGRNILVEKDDYKTGDVLKVEVPSQKILDVYRLDRGNLAYIIGGNHVGEVAVIEDYIETRSPSPNIVKFKDGTSTVKDNVFVIGTKVPEIDLPEASVL
ncbi:MAG: 30S ribosomal protein S4e [Methanomassiliicoccales archaeon]|jgi:small subunit ribosomal protein S4e|nr:30S ribosomal protein S4e [Methanomassiliicoccales archaeon]